jgi:hypothetical protein
MEFVGAGECFDHLSTLQIIEANGTAVFLLLWARGRLLLLLKLEARDRVYDVFDLLGRW